ncbi:MAG: hypothetical protein L6N94_03605 [Candidatus Methylarchaceae archaeon HK01M]|nr:hypothetical protein [Candidatus Methylarchaceae archaeon HK01M]
MLLHYYKNKISCHFQALRATVLFFIVDALYLNAININYSDLQAIWLTALLYNVSHPPYSHSVEIAFGSSSFDQKFSHEEFTSTSFG